MWHLGNERRDRQKPEPPVSVVTNRPSAASQTALPHPLLIPPTPHKAATVATPSNVLAQAVAKRFPFQLSNTSKPLVELMHSDTALLLQNALIDTANGARVPVPAELRSSGDPGSYLVQARGPTTESFRTAIRDAGGKIISYIPNNAYLVQATEDVAQILRTMPRTQSVQPYEPYYKLSQELFQPLPEGSWLRVTVFPGEQETARQALVALGAEIKGQSRTPFGPQWVVSGLKETTPVARLAQVQLVERFYERRAANDLARVRVRVSTNTVDLAPAGNHLGLTGAGVRVNVNDTGIDASHPDLAGRVFPAGITDTDGHGTHVAGIIASSGANSPSVSVGTNGISNVPGSTNGANFRGMAPAAELFWQSIGNLFVGNLLGDDTLQEGAALNGARISNNSWGYPYFAYDSAAASFDEAVRDSARGTTGDQSVMYIFAAGNSGFGDSTGQGGFPGSINSPGSAKNVVTVGAIDQLRRITNLVTFPDGAGGFITNAIFLGETDSDNEVAPFSSRGNVGIGLEGPFGRFKPDMVAPGAFVASTRSSQMVQNTNFFTAPVIVLTPNEIVQPNQLNQYQIDIPPGGVFLLVRVLPNANSPVPLPNLPIYGRAGAPPTTADFQSLAFAVIPVTPGPYFYAVGNMTAQPVSYDVQAVVVASNPVGNYFQVLNTLNSPLAPFYRYESGTSMASPVVAGLAALIEEYLVTQGITNSSPALKKALLINGARAFNSSYNIQADNLVNDQGWGLVNLSNSLPSALGGGYSSTSPIQFFDQTITESLATGDSVTRVLTLNSNAQNAALRITLVWTDPPGNPAASLKLVNDLDLIVTNLVTGEVFVGNAVGGVDGFSLPAPTNAPPTFDVVNNVENVNLDLPLSVSYSVTVRARRVNVNSRDDYFNTTGTLNDVVQDFALVISSDVSSSNAIGPFSVSAPIMANDPTPFVTGVTNVSSTNAQPLFNQRVGANSSLLFATTTNGMANQWAFYVVTNNVPGGTNVAFATFFPPNLSRTRNQQADIDLFVSTDPTLTNLSTAAVDGALKSVQRGGTELIVLNNSTPGAVYYVGVKSEDAQGADFGFFSLASANPFSQRDTNGNLIVTAQNVPAFVRDGTPSMPEATMVFGIAVDDGLPGVIRRMIVTNTLTHELMGDLQGRLKGPPQLGTGAGVAGNPAGTEIVLNSHNFVGPGDFTGTRVMVYDDAGDSNLVVQPGEFITKSIGPGSLQDFVGESAFGLWELTMIDNQNDHVGSVDSFSFRVEPALGTNTVISNRVIVPGGSILEVVDVPAGATNFTVAVTAINGGPVEVYIRRGLPPIQGVYNLDKYALLSPASGAISIGPNDNPPLAPGRYFILFANPSPVNPITITYQFIIELGPVPATPVTYRSTGPVTLIDDAVTNSVITVLTNRQVVDVQVGVRIDHARVSDLVLHLVSPQGTRVLLVENRGGPAGADFGSGTGTNTIFTVFTEDPGLSTLPIKYGTAPFINNNALSNINFYLPEEVMSVLRGQDAQGDWRLELWDNRLGAPAGQLLEWNLTLYFASPQVLFNVLANGNCATNILVGNAIHFYAVVTPLVAQIATNTLANFGASGIELLFNQNFLPSGFSPGDFTLLSLPAAGLADAVLTTNSTPPFVPTRTYYLAVRNTLGTGTNPYSLCLNFDVRALNSGNMNMLDGGILAGSTNLDYYQYNVPFGAVTSLFELINIVGGDANLVIRRGVLFPDQSLWDYQSISPGTASEQIIVTPFSTPVPLTPGNWNIGVYNVTTNQNVTYKVQVSSFDATGLPLSLGYQPVSFAPPGSVANTATNNLNQLRWHTLVGHQYLVQYSSNMVQWLTLTNFTANDVISVVTDPTSYSTLSQRFYRLVPQ